MGVHCTTDIIGTSVPRPETKIGPEFVAHLERLPKAHPVRAVLLSELSRPSTRQRRPSRAERQEMLQRVRSRAERTLLVIDAILEQQGGRRTRDPDALGTVTVEATAEGIRRLAAAPEVKAVLEDQPVFRLD